MKQVASRNVGRSWDGLGYNADFRLTIVAAMCPLQERDTFCVDFLHPPKLRDKILAGPTRRE